MERLTRVKGLAALLLLGALALPQSTCAGYRAPDGSFVAEIPRGAALGTYQPTIERNYAFDDVRLAKPGTWLEIAGFLWPCPLLVIATRSRSRRVRAFFSVLELVLALGSSYLIWKLASVIVTPASGAYLAVGALAVYFVASAVELWRSWRARPAAVPKRLTSAQVKRGR